MTILGIDPGTARMGWGIIYVEHGKPTIGPYGCLETSKDDEMGNRLVQIHDTMVELIQLYKPDAVSVEELYFSTNVKTAMTVSQARGVILLSAALCKTPVVSYSPLVVKQTITGSGKADKKQMQTMVTYTLKLKTIPQPDDTADAIAIALTHAYSYKMKGHLS